MNDRLTNKFTDTLEEAYGADGAKGLEGELFMMKVFKKWGWEAEHFENDRQMQSKGIDVSFRNPKWRSAYTGDVKNNIDHFGNFYVYRDWLFKVECDRIFHVNTDTGYVIWYSVEDMRNHFNHLINEPGDFIKFTNKTKPFFTSTQRITV